MSNVNNPPEHNPYAGKTGDPGKPTLSENPDASAPTAEALGLDPKTLQPLEGTPPE